MAEAVHTTANVPQTDWIESNKWSLSVRPDGQSATRYAQVAGVDLNNFVKSMLGYSKFNTDSSISRFPPETHPLRPNLYASSVEYVRELAEPSSSGPFDSLQYEVLEVAVGYQARPGVRLLPDSERPANMGLQNDRWRFVSQRKTFGLRARIIPLNVLYWCGPGPQQMVPEPSVMMEADSDIFLTWAQVPAVTDVDGTPRLPGNLEANIAKVVGRMNATTFRGCPPQTLVCLEPTLEMKSQPDGTEAFDIGLHLLQRGTKDVSGEPLTDLTPTPDWTRILDPSGMYGRVFRKGQSQTTSIYAAEVFDLLFETL